MDETLANNYARVRAERGWTWEQLASHLERTRGGAEAARWARSQIKDKSTRAERSGTERAVKRAPAKR